MSAASYEQDVAMLTWAKQLAQEAHDDLFCSRRGIFRLGQHSSYIAIYDNHPYAQDPAKRGREHVALWHRLSVRGIKIVTTAGCKEMVENYENPQPYTIASIYRCEGVNEAEAAIVIDEVWRDILGGLPEDRPN